MQHSLDPSIPIPELARPSPFKNPPPSWSLSLLSLPSLYPYAQLSSPTPPLSSFLHRSAYLFAANRCCPSPSLSPSLLLLELLEESLSWETLLPRRRLLWTPRRHRTDPVWEDGTGRGQRWGAEKHRYPHTVSTPRYSSVHGTLADTPVTQAQHTWSMRVHVLSSLHLPAFTFS